MLETDGCETDEMFIVVSDSECLWVAFLRLITMQIVNSHKDSTFCKFLFSFEPR